VKNWQLAPWRIRAASTLGAQLAAPFLGAFLCAHLFNHTKSRGKSAWDEKTSNQTEHGKTGRSVSILYVIQVYLVVFRLGTITRLQSY